MNETTTLRDILWGIKDIFPITAKDCVESLCGNACSLKEPWDVSSRLQGRFDHIFTLGNANAHFQAIMVVGIQNSSIDGFFKLDDTGDELLMDVFGEVANQFCGLLMDSSAFTDSFGILTQSVPQYSINQTFFPRVWGVDGCLWQQNAWMYIGYAIRAVSFGSPS